MLNWASKFADFFLYIGGKNPFPEIQLLPFTIKAKASIFIFSNINYLIIWLSPVKFYYISNMFCFCTFCNYIASYLLIVAFSESTISASLSSMLSPLLLSSSSSVLTFCSSRWSIWAVSDFQKHTHTHTKRQLQCQQNWAFCLKVLHPQDVDSWNTYYSNRIQKNHNLKLEKLKRM